MMFFLCGRWGELITPVQNVKLKLIHFVSECESVLPLCLYRGANIKTNKYPIMDRF